MATARAQVVGRVQAILRHSRLEVTMNLYVHALESDVREAVDLLGAAIR